MMTSLHNWFRRKFLRSERRAAIDAGANSQWLAGVFHEPRSSSFLALRQRELTYRLYLPAGIGRTERLPLLVMLHGCSQTAVEFAEAPAYGLAYSGPGGRPRSREEFDA